MALPSRFPQPFFVVVARNPLGKATGRAFITLSAVVAFGSRRCDKSMRKL
jgi:hypothetical protein